MNFLEKLNPFKNKNESQESIKNSEIKENSIEEQIEIEAKKLEENAANLKKEIRELGGEEKIKEALYKYPKIKRSFLGKFAMVLTIVGAFAGGRMLAKEFPEETDRVNDIIQMTEDAEDESRKGSYNFSVDKVSKQRQWLRNWIQERNIRPDDPLGLTKKRAVDLLDAINITHEDLGEDKGGEYIAYGKRRIALNIRKNQNEIFKDAPLHEFTHASTKGDVFIGNKERKIIKEAVKNIEDYWKINKEFEKKHPGLSLAPYDYVTSPEEFKAFLMVFRKALNLKPNQEINDEMIDKVFDQYKKGEMKDINARTTMSIIKDKQSLKRVLNELSVNLSDRAKGGQTESLA